MILKIAYAWVMFLEPLASFALYLKIRKNKKMVETGSNYHYSYNFYLMELSHNQRKFTFGIILENYILNLKPLDLKLEDKL